MICVRCGSEDGFKQCSQCGYYFCYECINNHSEAVEGEIDITFLNDEGKKYVLDKIEKNKKIIKLKHMINKEEKELKIIERKIYDYPKLKETLERMNLKINKNNINYEIPILDIGKLEIELSNGKDRIYEYRKEITNIDHDPLYIVNNNIQKLKYYCDYGSYIDKNKINNIMCYCEEQKLNFEEKSIISKLIFNNDYFNKFIK